MADKTSKMEEVEDKTMKMEAVADKTSEKEALADKANEMEALADKTSEMEAVADKTSEMEAVADKTSEMEAVADNTNGIEEEADKRNGMEEVADQSDSVTARANNEENTKSSKLRSKKREHENDNTDDNKSSPKKHKKIDIEAGEESGEQVKKPGTGDARTDESGFTAALVSKAPIRRSGKKVVGVDCEMVGVGFMGRKSVLARVSVVGGDGSVLLDRYVKPKWKVSDYRTKWSGVTKEHLRDGEQFKDVISEVKAIFNDAIIVGHDLKNDFAVMHIDPRKYDIRDTSKYLPFRELMGTNWSPSLKNLTQKVLGVNIQAGEHSSVQDAQATLQLYNSVGEEWEARLQRGEEPRHDLAPEVRMMLKPLPRPPGQDIKKKKTIKKKTVKKNNRKPRNSNKKKKKKVKTKKTHRGKCKV